MVGAAMENGIVFPPCFIEEGVRINAECYIRMLDDVYPPQCLARLGTDTSNWWWQEDNAPSHTSRRTPPAMTSLTCTRFFLVSFRPVLKHGPKSLTVGRVFFAGAKLANALKAPAWTLAQATDCDLESGSRKSISVGGPRLCFRRSRCLSPSLSLSPSPSFSLSLSFYLPLFLPLFLSLSLSLLLRSCLPLLHHIHLLLRLVVPSSSSSSSSPFFTFFSSPPSSSLSPIFPFFNRYFSNFTLFRHVFINFHAVVMTFRPHDHSIWPPTDPKTFRKKRC